MTDTEITETQLKLQDAATQMKLALSNSDDIAILRSCVNSFISHARSVTFVMQKESSGYPELEEWYKQKQLGLKQNPLLKFFNDKRVYSIHKGVVSPKVNTAKIHDLKIDGVSVPGPGIMTVISFDGVGEFIPRSSGNVFRLCEEYFIILKTLVQEWLVERKRYAQKNV